MDRRFWSGSAIVITVVIAGVTSLPGLLLRAPAEMPVVEVQPSVPAQPVTQSEPATATIAAAAPAEDAAVAPITAPPAVAAGAFPPVQPPTVEEAMQEPVPLAAPISGPARAQRPHEKAAAQEGKEHRRQRPVRPAIYPMREFLAWRR